MKRHQTLVPLSHDHHHALAEARRLRKASEAREDERLLAAQRFVEFFAGETTTHFREEEETLFPLLADAPDPAGELLVRALLEHQRLRAGVAVLRSELAAGLVAPQQLDALGALLEEHVRFEERELFPLLERTAPEQLALLDFAAGKRGPVWGTASEELNATILVWPPGEGPAEHVNTERDVVLAVLEGSATVTIDGTPQDVRAGEALVLEKGRARSITAGPQGVRYLTAHRRRPPLQIARSPR